MARLTKVVMVADDNAANRYIVCRILRHANYNTIEAKWGKEAVQLARQCRPDIIILDMNMPDQSGIVTLEHLRNDPCTASIPVVFLTAGAQSAFHGNCAEQLGASSYLLSPVQPDTLVAVVAGSIARATSPANVAEPNLGARTIQRNDYEQVVENAVALMRSDYASLQMLFPERGSGGELLLLSFRGFNPEAARFWEWVRADSKSTCGIALRENERVVASDIAGCDFMAGSEDQQVYLQAGIGACQTTPLIGHAGNVVGMISTHWRMPHKPSEKEFQLFDSLARQAAELIEREQAITNSVPVLGGEPHW
jgi:CheY-like chemotaxis protein